MITKALSTSTMAASMTETTENQRDDTAARTVWQACAWRIEPLRHRIVGAGLTRRLQPRQMDLLIYLIENRSRFVSRDEILANIWTTPHVSPHALSNAVSKLRQILGDDAGDQTYILTKRGVGYRFVAEAVAAPDSACEPASPIIWLTGVRNRPFAFAAAIAGAVLIVAGSVFLIRRERPPIGFAYSNDIAPVLETLDTEGWEIETEGAEE